MDKQHLETVCQFWDERAVRYVDSWLCYVSVKVHEVFDNKCSTECNWHLPLVNID